MWEAALAGLVTQRLIHAFNSLDDDACTLYVRSVRFVMDCPCLKFIYIYICIYIHNIYIYVNVRLLARPTAA